MKRHIFFRIILVIYIIIVGFLLFSTLSGVPQVPYKILGIESDKIVHFFMFVPFPFLAYFSLIRRDDKVMNTILTIVALFVAGCFFAALTEFIQGYLPMRVRDINDYKADMLGMILGSLVTFITTIHISRSK